MSIRDLRDLGSRLRVDMSRVVEKHELIQKLVDSGRIDIIAAPEPVEYPLSLLRGMGIGELKRCMADAGVFFDPVDVVEKEDMVVIFVNSGRLVLLPEEEEPATPESDSPDGVAESSRSVSDDTSSRERPDLDGVDSAEVTASGLPVVTTVYDSDDDDLQGNATAHGVDQDSPHAWMEPVSDVDLSQISHHGTPDEHTGEESSCANADNPQMENVTMDESPLNADAVVHGVDPLQDSSRWTETGYDADETPTSQDENPDAGSLEDNISVVNGDDQEMNTVAENESPSIEDVDMPDAIDVSGPATHEETSHHTHSESDNATLVDEYASSTPVEDPRFHERSIADLQALARELHVDITDCIERSEIIHRIVNAAGRPDEHLEANDFSNWSVSDLRALAREVRVDFPQGADRDDMIERLLGAANARPQVADYLSALTPLARLTVPQLRALAREWQVNVYDCLEKEEMIHRLVIAGGPSS